MQALDYQGKPVYAGMPVTREEHARSAEWIAAKFDVIWREALAKRVAMAYAKPPVSKSAAIARQREYEDLTVEVERATWSKNAYQETARRIRAGE